MSAATFAARLAKGPPLLLDGGLASELERRGAPLDDDLWSARLLLQDPALIASVHEDYADAGCDIVTTASYQASLAGFARLGLSPEGAAHRVEHSVALARGSGAPFVAGSVGPYGATLAGGAEYTGGYSLPTEELETFHAWRVDALLRAGADVLACETLPLLDEAALLAALVQERGGALWLSFSCRDERTLGGGQRIEEAARLAEECDAVLAVGVNCVAPPLAAAALRRLSKVTDKPLVAYPNRGEPWDAERGRFLPVSPARDVSEDGRALLAAGARIVGGCCRTTPDDARQLATALRAPPAGRSPPR